MPATVAAPGTRFWLLLGLFFTTLATLMLEVLDTRLLSVLTWYHLSFLAVSVAMLGMSAGAVLVFVGGDRFMPPRALAVLPRAATVFAVALAVSHVANLLIPFPWTGEAAAMTFALLVATIVSLTIPFLLSGIVVTLALTRTGGSIGLLYGADLVGAAAGCLAVIWLLDLSDITSTAFAAAGAAGLGGWCFARYVRRGSGGAGVVAVWLIGLAVVNANSESRLGIVYAKGRSIGARAHPVDLIEWNAHSNVIIRSPVAGFAFFWGPAANAPRVPVTLAHAAIDGDAGTVITKWDGRPESLDWVQYDVTSLPYRLREGNVAVIGVGGGRDILTAIWAGNQTVTGIELNEIFVRALQGRYREFAGIAAHPSVSLVHDEARSYLARVDRRFDILQMSLIDTWAATGAGAFTLTENGLYTRQAWQIFLRALTPTGVFSVSRWFDPETVSETTRLVSLGVASLLDAGVAAPRQHLILVTRERIATLVVSPAPFSEVDRQRLQTVANTFGFLVRVSPWHTAGGQLHRIADSRSLQELNTAAGDPNFDFTPPTDDRPFFFNMLKPSAALRGELPASPGALGGNLRATLTLFWLAGAATVLVLAIIVMPLLSMGRPPAAPSLFAAMGTYFGLIGLAFMFVQIPFLQRFSVYLGHPTYTFSIILFLMILSAGLGSVASERLSVEERRLTLLPLGIGTLVLVEAALLQSAIDRTTHWELVGRTAVVAAFVAPLAFVLGSCFPVGMRLIAGHSDRIAAWMWGINGACGVIASIVAVMVSMHVGIHANFVIAAALYALLAAPMHRLISLRAGLPRESSSVAPV